MLVSSSRNYTVSRGRAKQTASLSAAEGDVERPRAAILWAV
jgi:hypothetical protein